jgi:hypothetical protein
MFSETRNIKLHDGNILNISMTDEFVSRVRAQFGLSESTNVEDDHVRMFLFGSVKSALDKAEAQPSHE